MHFHMSPSCFELHGCW